MFKDFLISSTPTDFPHIELSRPSDGKSFSGSGSVVRDSEGSLHLKMYAQGTLTDGFGLVNIAPGKIAKNDELFELNATDMRGRVWTTDNVWPRADTTFAAPIAVLNMRLNRLQTREPRDAADSCCITQGYNCDVQYPSNQVEQIERRIGELRWEQFTHNAAVIRVGPDTLRLFRESGFLVARLSGEWSDDRHNDIARSVTNSLQFVFGRRMFPEVATFVGGNERSRLVNSVPRVRTTATVLRPLEWTSGGVADGTWKLLDAYYAFVRQGDQGHARELRRWTSEVVDSGNTPVEIGALVLTIAVEGVAKLFQGQTQRDDGLDDEVDTVIEALKSAVPSAKLLPRCIGAINSMRRPRASDYLHGLVDSGELPEEYLDSWSRLRHQSAHADAVDTEALDELLLHMHRVHALFYRLVFKLIGYDGPFTDYGQEGWPTLGSGACRRTT